MFQTPHFVTGNFKSYAFHLQDEEYSRALDCIVKACTDILIVNEENGKILLGKRKVEPQMDWWFIGGRMKPGETVEQSATRLITRELSLSGLNDEQTFKRFKTVGHYSFVWGMRNQPPKDHGTADLSTVLTITLTKDEISQIKMDEAEYDDIAWVDADVICGSEGSVNGASVSFHPALKKATNDYLSLLLWKQLETAATDDTPEHKFRQLVQQFIALKNK